MRYAQIPIQTHREPPAQARSAGQAFLIRAGYLSHSGGLLPLGQFALQRLKKLAATDPSFLSHLALPLFFGKSDVFYPTAAGDTEILYCPGCGFASRLDLAPVKKTVYSAEAPAPLERVLTPNCPTIESLTAFLGLPPQKTAKALMFVRTPKARNSGVHNLPILESAPDFVFVVIRGDMTLSQAKLTSLVGDVRLAAENEIRAAGAVPGYASPLGIQNALIVVDDLIPASPNLAAGANQAGYHIKNVNYGRDYTANLVADLTLAAAGDPCIHCSAPLKGQKAWLLASGGEYDFENILLALAETHHDDKGLTLPPSAAPFDVYLMHVPGKTLNTLPVAEELYRTLTDAGFSVLFDDRNDRAGVKFNDADVIGCPLRITVGERGLQNGVVELKKRTAGEIQQAAMNDLVKRIRNE